MFLALAVSLGSAWFGRNLYDARQDEAAIETLERASAEVLFANAPHRAGGLTVSTLGWPWPDRERAPMWKQALGIDDPPRVSFVELSANAGDSEAATAVAALARFPEIEVLALVGPAFDDRTCQTLAKLDGLEHLGLAETRIGPAGIERLASLYRLRSLGIRGSEGTESEGIFPALPGLAELQELYLEKTPLSRSDVAVIAALPNLRTLVITEPQQQDENVFADLGSAKDLRTLVLETQPLPEEERDLIAQELTKLRRLECLRISLSDDESLEGLPALPDLRSLDVKGDFNLKTADFDLRGSISDAALCEWSAKAPNCIVRYEIPSSQPRWFRAGERVDDESVWQDFWKRWTSSSETSP